MNKNTEISLNITNLSFKKWEQLCSVALSGKPIKGWVIVEVGGLTCNEGITIGNTSIKAIRSDKYHGVIACNDDVELIK